MSEAQTLTVGDGLPAVEGVGHRFVNAGGLRVHLGEAGEGDPVLLLHGWPQHWYMWRRVIERMAPSHRLLAPDLRGFGWTETPGTGYDCETFARDQIALLDELGLERVKLIGHDWGGWTAMLLGLLYPERIERMVVCNAPHPWPRLQPRLAAELWRGWYTWVMATPGLGTAALRRGFPRVILTNGNVGSPFSDEEVDGYVRKLAEPERVRATIGLYRYYQRVFREAAVGRWADQRLTVPTLLLFGEQDLYVSPRLIGDPGGRADRLRIEMVPDSGHFVVDEKPELVAARALDLFAA